ELGGQVGRLRRPGLRVLVHVVLVVYVVQYAFGVWVDGAADGAVHGREAGEGGQPTRADTSSDGDVGVGDHVDEGGDALGARGTRHPDGPLDALGVGADGEQHAITLGPGDAQCLRSGGDDFDGNGIEALSEPVETAVFRAVGQAEGVDG